MVSSAMRKVTDLSERLRLFLHDMHTINPGDQPGASSKTTPNRKRRRSLTPEATAKEIAVGATTATTSSVPSEALVATETKATSFTTVHAVAATRNDTRGSDLLDLVESFLKRFVAYPSGAARIAHVLWIAHTHLMDVWDSTPRIAFLSPEVGSGKTRALEVTDLLVPSPILTNNVTPAYIIRKVADDGGLPTLLYDETDSIFGAKARENEELRGLLNAGHRKGAVVGRCVRVEGDIQTMELPVYCAVALAGLGDLPDTLMSRSIVVRMQRRASTEEVEPFRLRDQEPLGHNLRDALAAWTSTIEVNEWPVMPKEITDRQADIWEAPFVLADAAGGEWPNRARRAAVTLVTDVTAVRPSPGVQLLADLRTVFDMHTSSKLTSKNILAALNAMEEAPWGNLRGQPLDARNLSRLLNQYGVRSKTVRMGDENAKGYDRRDLDAAFSRYL